MNKKIAIALFIVCFLLDQITKWLVLEYIPVGHSIAVIPDFFYLVQVWNTGAAFGSFSNSNTAFIVFTIIILCVIIFMAWCGKFRTVLSRTAATLLIAGALGNLTDRILHGHVIDFLDFILPWYGHWPAFNIADSCICIAATFIILAAFTEKER